MTGLKCLLDIGAATLSGCHKLKRKRNLKGQK